MTSSSHSSAHQQTKSEKSEEEQVQSAVQQFADALPDVGVEEISQKMMPYLAEAQRTLWTSLGFFLAFGAVGFIYYQNILRFVIKTMNLGGINLVLTSPTQFIDLAINTALILGVIGTLPYMVFCILKFTLPALKQKERRIVLSLIPLSVCLFVFGFGFGIWIEQFVIQLYAQTTLDFNVSNLWDIGHFLAQMMIMGLCLSLVFQLPIILSLLLRLHIIKRQQLVDKRRYAYAAIVLFAAILPPNDLISLTFIIVPLVFLFESTLLLNRTI